MLTGVQIRMALGALGWSAEEQAEKANAASKTGGHTPFSRGIPPGSTLQVVAKLKPVEEPVGIEFIGSPVSAPGIRTHGGSELP